MIDGINLMVELIDFKFENLIYKGSRTFFKHDSLYEILFRNLDNLSLEGVAYNRVVVVLI